MAHVGKIKVPVEICSCERERLQAINALLSEQLAEARQWHLAAVKEKLAARADAERLFTALDGYIMARITGTDLRAYDDLAERAARAHRALLADELLDESWELPRTVLDPETGIEEPVTTGRIPDAEFVEPPLMPPAASPDERLREALDLIAELADPDPCTYDHNGLCQAHSLDPRPCLHERARAALAVTDRDAEGVWPDQSAMHGVLLDQIKDAYAEGIADTIDRLRVRAAEMLPEVARFTLDEIEVAAADLLASSTAEKLASPRKRSASASDPMPLCDCEFCARPLRDHEEETR